MPRAKAKSGLPAPIPGEAFSLIGTLRRCKGALTVADVAELLQCPMPTIYERVRKGDIPPIDLGFDVVRIDPAAWAAMLEHKNPHLKPSARAANKAA